MKALTAIILVSSIVFSSCRKDSDQDDHVPATDDVYLKVEHSMDGSPLVLGDTLVDDFGSKITITAVKAYLSNFALDDQQMRKYLLVEGENKTYNIGTVPHETYDSFTVHVGVDSLTNHGDPFVWEAGHPLYFTNGTFWGWSEGYLFVIIEGLVDTDNNNTLDQGFLMHCGSDDFYEALTFSIPSQAVDGEYAVGVDIDWRRFLDGIDIKSDNVTHTSDNPNLARKVMTNVPSAITAL